MTNDELQTLADQIDVETNLNREKMIDDLTETHEREKE